MKDSIKCIVAAVALLGVTTLVGEAAETMATRTWTSTSGQKVEAEFIKVQFGMVHLKQADGKVIQIPREKLSAEDRKVVDAFAPPTKASKAVVELFGPKLTNARQQDISVNLLANKVIGVYFSAHWCPPCQVFTPKLVDFYNALKKEHKPFEIVFVSSDHNEKAMIGYMKEKKMPWLALPFGDKHTKTLAKKYGVRGIPMLVILDPSGKVITTNGRIDVQPGDIKAFDRWQADKK